VPTLIYKYYIKVINNEYVGLCVPFRIKAPLHYIKKVSEVLFTIVVYFSVYHLQASSAPSGAVTASGHRSRLSGRSKATEPSHWPRPEPAAWPGTCTERLHQSQPQKSSSFPLIGRRPCPSSPAGRRLHMDFERFIFSDNK